MKETRCATKVATNILIAVTAEVHVNFVVIGLTKMQKFAATGLLDLGASPTVVLLVKKSDLKDLSASDAALALLSSNEGH